MHSRLHSIIHGSTPVGKPLFNTTLLTILTMAKRFALINNNSQKHVTLLSHVLSLRFVTSPTLRPRCSISLRFVSVPSRAFPSSPPYMWVGQTATRASPRNSVCTTESGVAVLAICVRSGTFALELPTNVECGRNRRVLPPTLVTF